MTEVLDRNDLVYKVLPPRWVFGLPIGNGEVGGMVWVEDESRIVVTLDSVWAWDHRGAGLEDPETNNYARFRELMAQGDRDQATKNMRPPGPKQSKTYVGRLVIDVGRRITGEARLRLEDAEVELQVRTEDGETLGIRLAAYANLPVIAVDHAPLSAIREIRLDRLSAEKVGLGGVPEAQRGTTGSVSWIRQDIPTSPSIVLALLKGEKRSFATVKVTHDGVDPTDAAVAVLEEAAARSEDHLSDHRAWWRGFWQQSAVQVPDEKIETLWYMGLYTIASSSREGLCAPSLHGLWSPDGCIPPAHGFYIWDFYPQHWGLHGANHLEIGAVFCDHFMRILPHLKEQTKEYYGWDGVFVPGFMIEDGTWLHMGHVELMLWPGTSAWVAHGFWWQYRFSNDVEFLRTKAYPFMRECMLFYENRLEKGDGGKYHLNVSYSPEWRGWVNDDTLSLSLVRYLIRGLLEAVEVLGIDEPHLAQWQEILANLQPYHEDDSGLMLAEGLSYTESHRHMSHLAPLYPCDDLNVDGSPEDRQLINRSINNVVHKGYGTFVGWACTWLSSIAARAGMGKMAWWVLRQYADVFSSCNTYNLNLDWERNGVSTQTDTLCVDGNMEAVDAVNQMLIQSWGGRIRVFPACPSQWREARFDNLRAESGVEVSAIRRDGRTLGVRLESSSGGQVRLVNPFREEGGYLNGRSLKPTPEGDLVVELSAGQSVWVTVGPEGDPGELREFGVERAAGARNPYGLKYIDEGWVIQEPDIPSAHPHFHGSFMK